MPQTVRLSILGFAGGFLAVLIFHHATRACRRVGSLNKFTAIALQAIAASLPKVTGVTCCVVVALPR